MAGELLQIAGEI